MKYTDYVFSLNVIFFSLTLLTVCVSMCCEVVHTVMYLDVRWCCAPVRLETCCTVSYSWCAPVSYLGEVIKDVKAALGNSNVQGIFGVDVYCCPRLRKDYEIISMNRTLVLHWVIFHLQE